MFGALSSDLLTSCWTYNIGSDIITCPCSACMVTIYHVLLQKLQRQRNKRKQFRECKKAQKIRKWEEMCNNALVLRWTERSRKYQPDREEEIRQKELECNKKREALASALEETAIKIRTTNDDVETVNDNFVSVATELEKDECGSLNLSACSSCSCSKYSSKTVQTLERRMTLYRDMAEQLKAKNRRLRSEMHENVEAVRKFW